MRQDSARCSGPRKLLRASWGVLPAKRQNHLQADHTIVIRVQLLVTVDGEPTPDVRELQRLMIDTRIGREVPVVVVRQERAVHLRVRPTELTVPR